MAFIEITSDELERYLLSLSPKWERIELEYTNELVYEVPLKQHPRLVIRLYSTIAWNGERGQYVSRGWGKDAIRVLLFDLQTQKVVGKQKSTKRTDGWQNRLRLKMILLGESIAKYTCPRCANYMVERKSAKTKQAFFGCLSYPQCRHTTDCG